MRHTDAWCKDKVTGGSGRGGVCGGMVGVMDSFDRLLHLPGGGQRRRGGLWAHSVHIVPHSVMFTALTVALLNVKSGLRNIPRAVECSESLTAQCM